VEADPPADRHFPDLDRAPEWAVEREEETLEQEDVRFRYVTYKKTK
jgi:hypothetical protein